jgi:hypothetical protein
MSCSCPSHCDDHCVTCLKHQKVNVKILSKKYDLDRAPERFLPRSEKIEYIIEAHAEEFNEKDEEDESEESELQEDDGSGESNEENEHW